MKTKTTFFVVRKRKDLGYTYGFGGGRFPLPNSYRLGSDVPDAGETSLEL